MNELNFKKTALTNKNIFIAKLKLIYKMLTSDRFIFVELRDNETKQTINVQPILFNSTVEELKNVSRELHIRSIDVVYRDSSRAAKIMAALHSENNLTLAN